MKGKLVLAAVVLFGVAHAAELSEDLASKRNVAIGHFQNEDFGQAALHFKEAVKVAPKSVEDHLNWGLSVVKTDQHAKAIPILLETRKLLPNSPAIAYLLGVSYSRVGEYKKARDEFAKVVKLDPLSAPAYYNLGMALKRLDLAKKAEPYWKKTLQLNPKHTPSYFALYNLYARSDRSKEAKWAIEGYNRTKREKGGSGWSLKDVERSRYTTLAMYPMAPEKQTEKELSLTFVDSTTSMGLGDVRGQRDVLLADFDDDGDPDLLAGGALYANLGKKFKKVDRPTGLSVDQDLACAEAADLNGDGKLDLMVCNGSGLGLYEGKGDLSFVAFPTNPELVCGKKMSPTGARIVDYDHEGDLDIIVLCKDRKAEDRGGVRLLRNNGNNTFTDVTKTSRLATGGKSVSDVALSDIDGKHDIDLVFARGRSVPQFFLNQRDGTFVRQKAKRAVKSTEPIRRFLRGDLNADGRPDLVVLEESGKVRVWRNAGGAGFSEDLAVPWLGEFSTKLGAKGGALLDVDNDGDLDLFLAGGKRASGMALLRNNRLGGWFDDSAKALGSFEQMMQAERVLFADLDSDGDQDLLLTAPGEMLTVLENKGGNKNRMVRIKLSGRKNNSHGYGAKIEIHDGRFSVFRESFARWIDIGVGRRKKLQTLGIRWPTGIQQSEMDVKSSRKKPRVLDIAERPGLAESCPFVYAYDGKRFRFITDILDPTPVGVSLAPGFPYFPNHREAILIEGKYLKPTKDGSLRLAITQELAEITYLDHVRLYVVDHPKGTAVVPNDRFSVQPFAPFKIHNVPNPRFPKGAWDKTGRDIRRALLEVDRNYAFEVPYVSSRYPGVAKEAWELSLEIPANAFAQNTWLFLRGTMLWTEASVNFAISQNPDVNLTPIAVQARNGKGEWRTMIADAGVPAGVDKFLPIDLSGKLRAGDDRVRLSSRFAILWDQAFFSVQENQESAPMKVRKLSPQKANLRKRGFSKIHSPDGLLPDLYDYDKLQKVPPFSVVHAGLYTRFGRVRPLLAKADDEYVILAPGDDLQIEFSSEELPDLPKGWVRDYILDTDGYIKDGDWRTAHSTTIEPLPFHRMKEYPPKKGRTYPVSRHKEYFRKYQTRMIPKDLWVSGGI